MNKNDYFLNYILNNTYLTEHEFLYSTNLEYDFEIYEYSKFLEYKNNLLDNHNEYFKEINVLSFNDKKIFYVTCNELNSLIDLYFELYNADKASHNLLSIKFANDILKSRVYSEIEGTLSIEAVYTTRKRVEELESGKRTPSEKNDYIIKNMINGINYIFKKPEFNKDNLLKLYNILTDGCLEDDYKLKENKYYRYDEVEVDNFNGCPSIDIDKCMDSLFKFINDGLNGKINIPRFLLPHIAHYYIAYIHPYFDYNGRTARMVSYWINLLLGDINFPILSEAIDDSKEEYYTSLRNSRNANNDVTYFLIYIFKSLINYFNLYKNIDYIDDNLKNNDIVLSDLEKIYIKKILANSNGKFTYKDFKKWIKNDISKQGAFKILNNFVNYNVLIATDTKSKVKLFSINKDMLLYKINSFKTKRSYSV